MIKFFKANIDNETIFKIDTSDIKHIIKSHEYNTNSFIIEIHYHNKADLLRFKDSKHRDNLFSDIEEFLLNYKDEPKSGLVL